ncbi:MAG TPA: glycosyltransferase [Phycisphaerae bacterium]|nr:glycosyltransferase [Phycisphaerae bacterium]HRW53231.1 glycosyltransferase [Phycisphaerae bacterium]
MRVLHVIPDLNLIRGGPPQALRALARAQAATGDDVTVLPCRKSSGPHALEAGDHGNLHVLPGATHSNLKWISPSLKRAMLTAAEGRDILHVHGTWRYHSRVSPKVARKTGARLILRPYGNLGIVSRAHKGRIKSLYWNLFEKGVANAASAIHCASLKEAREIQTLGIRSRTFVVPNPVDNTLVDANADNEALVAACPVLKSFRHCLLFLGRIVFVKNLTALVEAFAGIAKDAPDWCLVIGGNPEDTALAERLRRMADELGVAERVCLPGMLVGEVKVAALQRASLFVQPSLHENFGVAAAEALQFGLPCVASDGVALADDIEAADAGVRCGTDATSMAAALLRLMRDSGGRERMGPNAQALAERFRPERVAEALRNEYRRCLSPGE